MSQKPKFDLSTSEGGRGYLAELFKTQLKRHDFTRYINERLAADFACSMSQYVEGMQARLAEQIYKNTTEVTRYNDELQGRLHLADELIREAWRLMDGQDGKTSGWHLLASHYINNPEASGVDIKAIGLIDTARVDLYERLHMQEFALVPYFDDSVGQWFIPPADDDQHEGQTFGTWRQAIDSLAQVGEQPLAQAADLSGFQWEDFQRIANKPGVHYALEGFSQDSTGDNGVMVVQAVIEALKNPKSTESPCIDCHGAGFCMSLMQEEIRCPCKAPIQFSAPIELPPRREPSFYTDGHYSAADLAAIWNGALMSAAAQLERAKMFMVINSNSAQAKHLEGLSYRDERDALRELLAIPSEIGRLINVQDNRHTDQPLFAVMEKRAMVTLDTHDHDRIEWYDSDNATTADARTAQRLEALHVAGREVKRWERYAVKDVDVFVTACFTEQGCIDFLARDGHNHTKPFIYAFGSYRNAEYQSLRNWLKALPAIIHSA